MYAVRAMTLRCHIVVVAALLMAEAATGAELRAGAAKVSITPRGSIWLAGRNHASDGVAGEIYARALALDDGSGGRAVFISIDLAGLPRSLTERVAADIMKAQDLQRSQIVFSATGARTAPQVKGLSPESEPADRAELRKIEQYTEALVRYLVQVAGAALVDLKPARLEFGTGRVPRAARAVGDENGVPVLRALSPKSGVIAILFGSAVVNTTLNDHLYAISGDMAGAAEAALEKEQPGAIALFLRTCGGSAEPRGTAEPARDGGALAGEVANVMKSPMVPVRGRLQSALIETAISLAVKPGPEGEARTEMRQVPYAVQVVRFNEGFALVSLGGAVTPGCVQRIRKSVHDREIVVACCPGEDSAAAPVDGEAEERVLDAVTRACKRAGKR